MISGPDQVHPGYVNFISINYMHEAGEVLLDFGFRRGDAEADLLTSVVMTEQMLRNMVKICGGIIDQIDEQRAAAAISPSPSQVN